MRILMNSFVAILVVLVSGCTSTPANDKALNDPGYTVSIEDALASVGTGLGLMVKNKGETNFGLAVTEVEVKFNLTIKANDSNKFKGDGEVSGGSSSTNTNSTSKERAIASSDIGKKTENQSTTGENSSTDSSKERDTSKSSQASSKSSAGMSNETGLKGRATLVLDKNASIDSDKSNNITVRFVGIPALVGSLPIEKLNFLKELGYFSGSLKPFGEDGRPLALFSERVDPETEKEINEALKNAVTMKK